MIRLARAEELLEDTEQIRSASDYEDKVLRVDNGTENDLY